MAYINGSDLLVGVKQNASKLAIGHSTSHTTTYDTDTKDRAVKPVATVGRTDSLWKEAGVTGQSVTIKAEGIRNDEEAEAGFPQLLAAYVAAEPVEIEGFVRGNTQPYISGKFVITSLEESAPAGDDVTYSVTLKNSGKVTIVSDNALPKA